jgi:hypothetical protein
MPRIPIEYFAPSGGAVPGGARANPGMFDREFEAAQKLVVGVGSSVNEGFKLNETIKVAETQQQLEKITSDVHAYTSERARELPSALDVRKWERVSIDGLSKMMEPPPGMSGGLLERWRGKMHVLRNTSVSNIKNTANATRIKRAGEMFESNWTSKIKDLSKGFIGLEDMTKFLSDSQQAGVISIERAHYLLGEAPREADKLRLSESIAVDPWAMSELAGNGSLFKESYPTLTEEERVTANRQATAEKARQNALFSERLLQDVLNGNFYTDAQLDQFVKIGRLDAKTGEALKEAVRAKIDNDPKEQARRLSVARDAMLMFDRNQPESKLLESKIKVHQAIAAVGGQLAIDLRRDFSEMIEGRGIYTREMTDVMDSIKAAYNKGKFGQWNKEEFVTVREKGGPSKKVSKKWVNEEVKASAQKRYFAILDGLAAHKRAHPNATRTELALVRDELMKADLLADVERAQNEQR